MKKKEGEIENEESEGRRKWERPVIKRGDTEMEERRTRKLALERSRGKKRRWKKNVRRLGKKKGG